MIFCKIFIIVWCAFWIYQGIKAVTFQIKTNKEIENEKHKS